MLRAKIKLIATTAGLPWPLRWNLSLTESLLLVPTLFMAVAFEILGDNFGKQGIPIQLPASWGAIQNFQPQLFPMEIYLLWMGMLTLSQARRWPLAKAFTPITLLTLALIVFGLGRALPDLHANPLLVIRNAAFVWYLALPLMIALYPMPSLKWESFFRVLYLISFFYFAVNLVLPLSVGSPPKVSWCINMGLLFAFAYGLCSPQIAGPRFALTAIGFVLGLSYFTTVQRTALVGLALTNALLFASPVLFSGSLPRPRWRRTAWVALGLAASVVSVATLRSYKKGSVDIFSEGVTAIATANPKRQSENNAQGLEKFRAYLWQDAWEEFLSAPLQGIGFLQPVVKRVYRGSGGFWDNSGSYEQLSRGNKEKISPPISGPHNSYLNALSRMGIIGLGFLLLHLMCGWQFLTRCYFACFFVLLWQMLYAALNVSMEGPIRSFPLLLLVGVGLKLAIEKSRGGSDDPFQSGFFPQKKINRARGTPDQPRRVGLVHVPYRFIGGEDQHVSVLRQSYRSIGLEPTNIPSEQASSDLLLNAARSLTIGSPSEWDAIVKKHSLDFLHINNIHAALGPAFLRWIISRNIPAIMTVHNHRFYCTNGLALYGSEVCKACRPKASFLRPILKNCNASLAKSIYHSSALKEIRGDDLLGKAVKLYLAPSPYIAKELQIAGIPAKNIRLFPHAVNVENASSAPHAPAPDVVYLGRLSPEKGITFLLAAAKILPKVSFAIVGDGPLAALVKEATISSPNVSFYGKMQQPEALAVMRSAKVACVPSVCHESFSLVAAEALSFGLRLVVPDTQSFLHYAEAPIEAITAIVTNPESLAYSLSMALEQPKRSVIETAVIRERYSVQGFQARLREVVGEVSN